jgi:N-acetyl-gamma-glutamyl-phosphate reductase
MDRIKVGIVGATGYTGSELVRILLEHPNVEISVITADSRKGEMFVDVHPQFNSIFNTKLVGIDELNEVELDIVFLALPHGISMDFVKDNADKKYKIVDLSGDFRLSHPNVYKEWYQKEHWDEKV